MRYKYGGNRTLKRVLFALVVVALLVALPFLILNKMEGHKTQISEWADANGYEVVEIESKWVDYGPFWFKDEDDEIYRVRLRDRYENEAVAWFRIGFWTFDQEWDD
jgi:hypothetical protein